MFMLRAPVLRARQLVFQNPKPALVNLHRFYSARVLTSVRGREEFFKLLATQDVLFANFCILTDPKGKSFSKALSEVGETSLSENSAIVDAELDEGDVNEVAMEFVIGENPAIVAFNRGQKIASFSTPQQWDDPEALSFQLRDWLENLHLPL